MFNGRETAATEPAPINKIDFEVGDLVQIRHGEHAGAVGKIIGIRLIKNTKGKEALYYCVQFSDISAAEYPAGRMRFLSAPEKPIF